MARIKQCAEAYRTGSNVNKESNTKGILHKAYYKRQTKGC